jgi:L-asparaginase
MKVFVLNAGGTLGMVGEPLRPAMSGDELLAGINVPKGLELTVADFELRQDSTNTMHADRVAMAARHIKANYDTHDAFVVLHGTDSLEETCAAFCMIFKLSLQKPLFVIGAQMTKDEPGSDVSMQISNTLRMAGAFHRHGIVGVYNVCIGDVLDGSRVRKRADSDPNAFHSPGRHPVAHAFPNIRLEEGLRRLDRVLAVQGVRLDTEFEPYVASFKVSADTPPWVLMDLVHNKRLNGVILEAKGSGNIPDREWDDPVRGLKYSWIDAIEAATKAGMHIAILSPFEDGRVNLDRYDLGKKAKKAGALSLESMTPGMADVKFRQAIAMHPDDPKRIQVYLSTNIVGELLPGIDEEADSWFRTNVGVSDRT